MRLNYFSVEYNIHRNRNFEKIMLRKHRDIKVKITIF